MTGTVITAITDRVALHERLEALQGAHRIVIRCSLDFPVFTWGATLLVTSGTQLEHMEFYGFPTLEYLVAKIEAWVGDEMARWIKDCEEFRQKALRGEGEMSCQKRE